MAPPEGPVLSYYRIDRWPKESDCAAYVVHHYYYL